MTESKPAEVATVLTLTWEELAALTTVGASAATDRGRPILMAVHLSTADGRLTAEATDSYSLARVSVASDAQGVDVLIPAKWLDEVRKATKVTRAPKRPVTLIIGADTVEASDGNVTLIAQVVAGNYPELNSIIPAEASYVHEFAAFNPSLLALMAKILPPVSAKDKERVWKVLSMSATRPSVWSTSTPVATALFLLMPVRVS